MFVHSDLDLLFDFRCSADQVASFEKRFTPEEVRSAFFPLPKNKTCGPDGFSAEFFTAAWSFIGPEVTEAVLILSVRIPPQAMELSVSGSHTEEAECLPYY